MISLVFSLPFSASLYLLVSSLYFSICHAKNVLCFVFCRRRLLSLSLLDRDIFLFLLRRPLCLLSLSRTLFLRLLLAESLALRHTQTQHKHQHITLSNSYITLHPSLPPSLPIGKRHPNRRPHRPRSQQRRPLHHRQQGHNNLTRQMQHITHTPPTFKKIPTFRRERQEK